MLCSICFCIWIANKFSYCSVHVEAFSTEVHSSCGVTFLFHTLFTWNISYRTSHWRIFCIMFLIKRTDWLVIGLLWRHEDTSGPLIHLSKVPYHRIHWVSQNVIVFRSISVTVTQVTVNVAHSVPKTMLCCNTVFSRIETSYLKNYCIVTIIDNLLLL